jgi:hypothetical protein
MKHGIVCTRREVLQIAEQSLGDKTAAHKVADVMNNLTVPLSTFLDVVRHGSCYVIFTTRGPIVSHKLKFGRFVYGIKRRALHKRFR